MKRLLIIGLVSIILLAASPLGTVLAADSDVTIDTSLVTSYHQIGAGRCGPFWTSPTVGYVIFVDSSNDLKYRKTSDGGGTWAAPVNIRTGYIQAFDCWADWQTAGDAGTKIHIAYIDSDSDDVRYVYLDTDGDSVGGDDQIEACQGSGTMYVLTGRDYHQISITKTRGGNLAVAFYYIDTDVAFFYSFYTSPDATAWTGETAPWENARDWFLLFPGNEADNQDMWAIFWDRSANEISLKTYDDSGDSWVAIGEQLISADMVDSGTYSQMDGAIRISDGYLIFAAWNLFDHANADLMVWDINGAGSITAKADVISNTIEYFLSSVFIDQSTDDIYISYAGGTAIFLLVEVFYQKSDDGGDTWGSQQAMQSDAEGDERMLSAGAMSSSWGGKFQPCWFNYGLQDLFTNTDNGISIAAPAAAPTVTTDAADDLEDTTATLNGTITDDGGEIVDYYGFVWDTGADQGNPGDADPSGPPGTWDFGWKSNVGDYGENPFDHGITGLPTGTTIYFRAGAHNSEGWAYGDGASFLTKPAAPTDVAATENQTDKVVITWTKSTGATDYHVWRDAVDLGAAGDVATFDDVGADTGTVTPGVASATDGTILAHSQLTLAGESINDGTTHTYKVVASNATGNSDDSTTDTGFRRPIDLTYQWYRSNADGDAGYVLTGGATNDPYNDVGFPVNGDGRWVYCEVNATGAVAQDSTHDRGYRGVLPTVTVQAVDDISYFTATGNGEITNIGSDNCDKQGFVWDLGSQGDPGNVAPGASGYANNGANTGDYGIGAYDYELTGLLDDTTYFVRAYTHNPAGYDYSNTEEEFKTLESVVPTVVTYNADVDGTNVTANGNITDTGGGDDDIRGFVWDTVTHANPLLDTPAASDYSDYWTEAGSFNVGVFDYEITGLTALVTYYYRACAHSDDGWAYGDEVTFFALAEGKVYLEFRPDLSETRITGNAANPSKPVDILVEDMFMGYILPIYADDDQELFFVHCVPNRWDNSKDPVFASHILVHIVSSLSDAGEEGRSYRLQLAWDEVTPNEEEIPAFAPNLRPRTRTVYSNTQYECYRDWFIIECNVDDGIEIDDLLALRVRRLFFTDDQDPADELLGDLIIHSIDILYPRGDLLGDPDGAVTTIINNLIAIGILIGGVDLIYLFLSLIALGLTMAMFHTRNMLLGFPCVIFWAVLGGYAYTESTVVWGDWQYYLFFASMGMVIFSALAMYALRTPKEEKEEGDEFIDEGKDETRYIDEGSPSEGDSPEGSEVSKRTKGVRGRAKERREKASRRMR